MNEIENLPKGALRDPLDERDFKVMGAPLMDFTKEFRLPEPPDSDQANSDCCVGEAWTYYHWQLKRKNYCVKSIFAYIALSYGAYIRDGGLRLVKFGQETLEETPDPNPKTPQNMRDKKGLNEADALDDRELDSFLLPDRSIDGVAWGIKNYNGVVFGVDGTNEGWKDLLNPRPPKEGEAQWGHALYAMGYHLHNGIKCIIAKSSWCNTGIKEHHIKENYFKSGHTFNPWTLIPKGQTMQLINDNGTVYLVAGSQNKRVTGIASQEVLQALFGDELITAGKIPQPPTQTLSNGIIIHKN